VLDWAMPELTGIRRPAPPAPGGIAIPVIFLRRCRRHLRAAALEGGAVDFIDKSRRLPILLKRLELIGKGCAQARAPERRREYCAAAISTTLRQPPRVLEGSHGRSEPDRNSRIIELLADPRRRGYRFTGRSMTLFTARLHRWARGRGLSRQRAHTY